MTTQLQGGRIEIVDIGVDSRGEKTRRDAANKNCVLGTETRIPQPNNEWHTLPTLLLCGLVVVIQRQPMAAAAV